jgi:hypothetical protein
MASCNHTPEVFTPSGGQERYLTVSLYPEAHPKVPWIRLRGQWLQRAGFKPRARIRVRVMTGCLVITTE